MKVVTAAIGLFLIMLFFVVIRLSWNAEKRTMDISIPPMPEWHEFTIPYSSRDIQREGNIVARFSGMSSQDLQNYLKETFRCSDSAIVNSLFDELFQIVSPKSIVVSNKKCWVRCGAKGGVDVFMPIDNDSSQIVDYLSDWNIPSTTVRFVELFSDVRDSPPGEAGEFVSEEILEFAESVSDCLKPNLGDWSNAVVIYYARNGDKFVLNNRGDMAWFVFAEEKIVPFRGSVASFFAIYLEAKKQGISLDSYFSVGL